MDPLDFLEHEELLNVFRCKKTEMSCMVNPQCFLNQLRDHNFVPEEKYKKVSRMKSKERIKSGLYEILDWVEQKRSENIQLFWKCVFEEVMLNQYPTLKLLHRSFLDGTFCSSTQLAQKVDKESSDTSEENQRSENEKRKRSSVRKKRKSVNDDGEEQPGPSSHVTPTKKKKSSKIIYSSPLKKGEKGDIWTWPIFRVQLPVTCGGKKGILHREKLAKGEKCILAEEQWLTPSEFEKFAGRERAKNWKLSIRCEKTPLGKLIQEGHLKAARISSRNKKSLSSLRIDTDSDEEDEDEENSSKDEESQPSPEEDNEDEEPQPTSANNENADQHNGENQIFFNVTCGSLTGKLYKKRFSTGDHRKSIRTEKRWMTPKEFAEEGSTQTNFLWKRDIQCEGKPLSSLIEQQLLRIHSLQCGCPICKPDENYLHEEENDDECWVCKKSEADENTELVVCDSCPRSFHQRCHLPHVDDSQLRDGKNWNCTICMFNSLQDCDVFEMVKKTRVMSCQMSRYTLECQYLLLSLGNADEKQIFATDPSLHLENYSSFVENPMWLRKVAEKLQKKEYQTVGQFVSDVQLIFTNCAAYHKSDMDTRIIGENLMQLFEKQFTATFNVHEKHADV